MTRYIAFLRALNVGGHIVKMDALRQYFEALGFKKVETFIASGNVIFETGSAAPAKLEAKIEAHLKNELGYAVATFLRTSADIQKVVAGQPFSEAAVQSAHSVHVAFLKASPLPDAVKALDTLKNENDEFRFAGREMYSLNRTPVNESKLTNAKFERTIGGPATFRNITTVTKLSIKYPA